MALPQWEEKVKTKEVEGKWGGDFFGSRCVPELWEKDGA